MSLPAFEAAGEMIPYQSAELASQFEDYFVSIYHMLEANELSSVQVKTLNDLDGVISAMKSKKGNDFWRLDALDVDPDWDEIRSSAKAALKTLPLQQQPF
ncbi:hypothetical protein [Novosphingobium gossypii]|uniref:hypothetical protein n=1 Tax=Novosphingobium gossypii TaxID=1604774 RepID=UPI003D24FC3D